MQNTDFVKEIIDRYNYKIISGPHIMLSNSTRLEKVAGENWMTVGDVAATFDPLSSNGILTAIGDGIDSSDIVKRHLEGKSWSTRVHNEKVIARFNAYLNERFFYYNLEKRWKNLPFWNRNQSLR